MGGDVALQLLAVHHINLVQSHMVGLAGVAGLHGCGVYAVAYFTSSAHFFALFDVDVIVGCKDTTYFRNEQRNFQKKLTFVLSNHISTIADLRKQYDRCI